MPVPQQTISLRISNDLCRELKVTAAARRQTPSELIRKLIEREIASLGAPIRGTSSSKNSQ